ncbi:MAG: class I SAM-dependent methyltransferase [Longimicrobiales bacterium]
MRECCAIDAHFTSDKARSQREELERNGPPEETRLLAEALADAGAAGCTILDVGAGIGIVTERLLASGARSGVLVEASSAYLDAAARYAAQRGLSDRLDFRHGDFVEIAATVASADIVALDKVICCYPEMRALVEQSAARAKWLLGATYPRDNWLVRTVIGFENLVRRFRGNPFRGYVHPVVEIEALLRASGFELRSLDQTRFWRVVVFVRPQDTRAIE